MARSLYGGIGASAYGYRSPTVSSLISHRSSTTAAQKLGLVTTLDNNPLAGAGRLAAELATKSPDALAAAKRLFNDSDHGIGPPSWRPAGDADVLHTAHFDALTLRPRERASYWRRAAPRASLTSSGVQVFDGSGSDVLGVEVTARGKRAPWPNS
jgi:hypothetical protein